MFRSKRGKNAKGPSSDSGVPYAYITFVQNLSDRDMSFLPHKDFAELNKQITDAITSDDDVKADLCAKKMALYYGVPGLLHLVELGIRSIKKQRAKGDLAESDAFNTLTHLYLAQIIYQNDPRAKDLLSRNPNAFPSVSTRNYWREQSNKLIELYPNLRKYNTDARKVALSMYKESDVRTDEERVKPLR